MGTPLIITYESIQFMNNQDCWTCYDSQADLYEMTLLITGRLYWMDQYGKCHF